MSSMRRSPRPVIRWGGTEMTHYAGIDVSLETSSICIVDAQGAIQREFKVESEPEVMVAALVGSGFALSRIGLEAGPLSQWFHAGLAKAGLPVVLLETRQLRATTKAMPIKTDQSDARAMAQMVRTGWYKAVHVKSELLQGWRPEAVSLALLSGASCWWPSCAVSTMASVACCAGSASRSDRSG
jgi:hypothetical protein